MSTVQTKKSIRISKGQVWDCGDWGRLRVEGTARRGGNACVDLVHMSGGSNNSVRGDKVGLFRKSFEDGTYKRVK